MGSLFRLLSLDIRRDTDEYAARGRTPREIEGGGARGGAGGGGEGGGGGGGGGRGGGGGEEEEEEEEEDSAAVAAYRYQTPGLTRCATCELPNSRARWESAGCAVRDALFTKRRPRCPPFSLLLLEKISRQSRGSFSRELAEAEASRLFASSGSIEAAPGSF